MYDPSKSPTPPDETEPQYNAVTRGDWQTADPDELADLFTDDITPQYNPATMELIDNEDEDDQS